MEDPAILRLNLAHYRRLLEIETDPEKRRIVMALMAEIEAELGPEHAARRNGLSQTGRR